MIAADTVLAYKQRNKIGRFADKTTEGTEQVQHIDIPLGARCEVESSEEDFRKRGTVRFVGPTEFAKGVWVGVEYDQAVGPVGDVGEAKRRSRGGSCGGVSPSYGFDNRDRPSSVSVLGAALCTASVSRRPGLSAK